MNCFQRIAIIALIACSSLGAWKASAAEAAAKSVVLVHGAFADGSSWAKVIPLLQAKGLNVIAVQNPLSSLAADVDAARRAIEAQTGPVILVGHSYGGVVITQAGVHPKVEHWSMSRPLRRRRASPSMDLAKVSLRRPGRAASKLTVEAISP